MFHSEKVLVLYKSLSSVVLGVLRFESVSDTEGCPLMMMSPLLPAEENDAAFYCVAGESNHS